MYSNISSENYRNNIISYFKFKDKNIYDILQNNILDWRFPFKTTYAISKNTDEDVNLLSFLASCSVFNENKNPIRNKSSFTLPERGDSFLKKIISNNEVNKVISTFIMSTYIASRILDKYKKDQYLNWIMTYPTKIDGKEYTSQYIIVDTPNVYKSIRYYEGKNPSLIRFRDDIIRNRDMNECIEEFIRYIVEDLNGNFYKYIFIIPGKYKKLEDVFYAIPVECNEYIGSRCSKETFSNEVDDCLILMLYDWCKNKYDVDVSILSGDNYDFSLITQDYSDPIERAIFSNNRNSIIVNWTDLKLQYPGLVFDKTNPLTLFEENFSISKEYEDDDINTGSDSESEDEENS